MVGVERSIKSQFRSWMIETWKRDALLLWPHANHSLPFVVTSTARAVCVQLFVSFVLPRIHGDLGSHHYAYYKRVDCCFFLSFRSTILNHNLQLNGICFGIEARRSACYILGKKGKLVCGTAKEKEKEREREHNHMVWNTSHWTQLQQLELDSAVLTQLLFGSQHLSLNLPSPLVEHSLRFVVCLSRCPKIVQ